MGLLGGMLGWPGSEWSETVTDAAPPVEADWKDPGLEVRHTFTHFHLRLTLRLARVPVTAQATRGEFLAPAMFGPSDLPTVMRKVYDLASSDPMLIEDIRSGV